MPLFLLELPVNLAGNQPRDPFEVEHVVIHGPGRGQGERDECYF